VAGREFFNRVISLPAALTVSFQQGIRHTANLKAGILPSRIPPVFDP
jgi:hypothetical protein